MLQTRRYRPSSELETPERGLSSESARRSHKQEAGSECIEACFWLDDRSIELICTCCAVTIMAVG